MADFPLLLLDSLLLTKIINKLEEKSYFRLQQTSKLMNETIRSNKQICVHVSVPNRGYELYFKNEEGRNKWLGEIDADCFYGVRFDKYFHRDCDYGEKPEIIRKNTEDLKKYRITCDKLDLTFPGTSTDQMLMLLDVLKPRIASVQGFSERHPDDDAEKTEVLLQSKTLKGVYVSLDAEHGARLVPQLFAKFSSVHINGNVYDNEEQLKLLRTILETLRTQPCPHLRNVSLWSYPMGELLEQTTFDEVRKEFSDLTWTYEKEEGEYDNGDWFWSHQGVDNGESESEHDESEEEEDSVDEDEEEDDSEQNVEGREDEEDMGGPPEANETDEEGEETDDEMEEDGEDDMEDDDDYGEDAESIREELIERFIAVVDLPNGRSGRIEVENSSERFRTGLRFQMGDREPFRYY